MKTEISAEKATVIDEEIAALIAEGNCNKAALVEVIDRHIRPFKHGHRIDILGDVTPDFSFEYRSEDEDEQGNPVDISYFILEFFE